MNGPVTYAHIEERARAIAGLAGFRLPRWWLTFYLTAAPSDLDQLAVELASFDAVNLDGGGGGFLYPKVPVANEPGAVADLVCNIRALALRRDVEVLSVDVDTSPEVERSAFKELIRFGRNDRQRPKPWTPPTRAKSLP